MLSSCRVLDASSGIPGAYAAKLLADAGADVITLEPPGGDPLRRWSATATLEGGEPPVDGGALFEFLHTSKRSITGSIADPGVDALLADVDIVIESAAPGAVEALGIRRRHPHLVVVSVTPWGRGPWADRPATEFTLQAACGGIAKRGWPESPPVQAGGRIGEWCAGVYAGVAALAGWQLARRSGSGQHLDVSWFEAMTLCMNTYTYLLADFTGWPEVTLPNRTVELPSIEPTADGYVGFCTVAAQQFQDFLVLIGAPEWQGDPEYATWPRRWANRDEFIKRVHAYTTVNTTADILELASILRIPVAPIGTGATVRDLPPFQGRDTFVENPSGGFTQPRPPYRIHGVPATPLRPAPRAGEHDGRIEARPRAVVEPDGATLPLTGVRVLDLTAWWAGPIAAHALAQLGADVVKVESIQRPDGMRFASSKPPSTEDWWEWGMVYHGANTAKRAITLDLTRPEGRSLLLRLAERADVLIENFSPRVMDNFGLGWDALHAANPRLIMTRMPAFGLDGPWRDNTGFAQTMEQVTGMAWITGHVDEAPQIPRGPCDPLAGMHAVFATLVALQERSASGVGRLVEVTMVEAALNAGAEQIVEYSAYGRSMHRAGNRGPTAAPQGLYACRGHEQWLALAVEDDEQWAGLRRALGDPSWAAAERFATASGRREHHDELDAHLAAWAAEQSLDEAVDALVARSVPAAAAIVDRDVVFNPHLAARGFIEELDHPVVGRHGFPTLPVRILGRAEPWLRRPAPTLGEHTAEILAEIGLDAEELTALEAEGIVGRRPVGL